MLIRPPEFTSLLGANQWQNIKIPPIYLAFSLTLIGITEDPFSVMGQPIS